MYRFSEIGNVSLDFINKNLMPQKKVMKKANSCLKIVHVVGARPNFMKAAPIMQEMSRYPAQFNQILVHTGQHYDKNMSDVFFENINLPDPDIHLGVGSGTHAQQTARVMLALEPVLLERQPDWLFIVGDVNSTLAGAVTATKLGIKVAHVEAGLRSFDRTMPEEYNRVLTDHIADLLFTTEDSANKNLRREGIPEDRIFFVGNVMIDTLIKLLPKAKESTILSQLGLEKKKKDKYVLVTLHRPSNVDKIEALKEIMASLDDISKVSPVIFPVHPRTKNRIKQSKIKTESSSFHIIDPLPYLDFLSLMRCAALVITDSGGIQEETTYLGIPCLTVRPNTERPVTIEMGTNRLVDARRDVLKETALASLKNSQYLSEPKHPPLWDGRAAERIVKIMLSRL